MEKEIGITYKWHKNNNGYIIHPKSKYGLIFYADDFVILCESKEEAEGITDKLSPYLERRGLELSPEKTRITHIREGFNFLGFNIRQYSVQKGNKLLIKPSKESIKKAKSKIKETFLQLRGEPVVAVITILSFHFICLPIGVFNTGIGYHPKRRFLPSAGQFKIFRS